MIVYVSINSFLYDSLYYYNGFTSHILNCIAGVYAYRRGIIFFIEISRTKPKLNLKNLKIKYNNGMQAGQCSTVGYGFEHTQYRVLLKPRLFFSSLPLITGKYIGFYGTTLSGCLMVVPTNSLLVSYLIHFLPV